MSWRIRPASQSDAVELKHCMQLAYFPYLERLGGMRLPPMDLDYEKEISEYPTWIAMVEDSVVGSITMMFESDHASIANVGVDPRHQGKGLGKGLMQFGENEAIRRKYSEIRLVTHVALEESISLYRYLGWAEYERDGNRVYMRKVLE